MRHTFRTFPRKLSIFVGVFVMVATAMPVPPAAATANFGPDPDDFGPGGNIISYAVSNDGYTDIAETHLKIYSKGERIAIFIANADLCEGNREVAGAIDKHYSGANSILNGNQVTTFAGKNQDGSPVIVTGTKRTSAYCATGDGQTQWPSAGDALGSNKAQTTREIRLARNPGPPDPTVGDNRLPGRNDTYEYELDITWDANGACGVGACGLNAFRIKVLNLDYGATNYGSGSNIWVSQDPTKDASQFGVEPGLRPDSNYFNHTTYFAPDCSLNAQTVTKRIVIYDDDNHSNASVQPTTDPFEVSVQRKTRYGGSWAVQNLVSADISSPAGLDRKAELADGWWRLGTAGNKNKINIDFTVNADYIYRFAVRKLWYNNTLQFQMPYSSVWAEQFNQCQKLVSPQIDLETNGVASTTANVGDTVTARYKVNNVSNDFYNGNVNFRRYLYWDTGGSTGYEPANGDQLINPQPASCASSANPNGHLQNNATTTYGPSTIGATADISLGCYQGTARVDSNYVRICAAMVLYADDSNTVVTSPGWLIRCTVIGKYPGMQVQGGDVRTGGSFSPRPNCTVSSTDASVYKPFSVIGHDYGGPSYHSRAEYGILSPGFINQFASDSLGSGPVTADLLSYANNTGVPPVTYDGIFYGTVTSGVAKVTHCVSDVFSSGRYADPVAPTGFTSGVTVPITSGLSYKFNFTGSNQVLQLPAITLGATQRTVIRVTNTGGGTGNSVRLAGDIKYSVAGLTNIYSLPQFVLLADSSTASMQVNVNNAVTRLDGIYASRSTPSGNFNTCTIFAEDPGNDDLGNGSSCDNQLNVNGAVITRGSLKPYRTAWHNTSANDSPAEIFNLRPDTLIGDYASSATGNLILTTVDQREVAPRY